MKAFSFFLAGSLSGVLSSLPIGPVNFWVVKAALPPRKKTSQIIAFISAIILSDIVIAMVAFWGFYVFLQGTFWESALAVGGSLMLCFLGVYELLFATKVESSSLKISHSSHWVKDFLWGLVFGLNPGFIAFWTYISTLLSTWGLNDLIHWPVHCFFLGIAVGDGLWYSIVYVGTLKGSSFLTESGIRKLKIGVGWGYLIIGLSALVKIFGGELWK